MALRFQATKIISGSGPPGVDAGDFGDLYFDTSNDVLYGPKGETGWGEGVSLVGPSGLDGVSLSASFDGDELVVMDADTGDELARRNVRGLPGEDGSDGSDGDSLAAVFEEYELIVSNARTGAEMARADLRGSPGTDGEDGNDGDSLNAAFEGDDLVITNARTGAELARLDVRGLPGADGDDGTSITAAFEGFELVVKNAETGTEITRTNLRGEPGERGSRGTGLSFKGTLASPANLPNPAEVGDTYLIDGHLWVYSVESAWVDGGEIGLSAEDIMQIVLANDGAGSGVDADLLDGKEGGEYQPAGDYATSEDLDAGLSEKQDAGDYATNSSLAALADALGGKSDSGHLHDDRYQQLSLLDTPGHPTTTDPVTGKHRLDDMPDELLGKMDRQGLWNAQTNTPDLGAMVKREGWYWIVSVEGTTNYGGKSDWKPKDWIVWNGSDFEWVDNTDSVATVFGRAGNIEARSGDYTAEQVGAREAGDVPWGEVSGKPSVYPPATHEDMHDSRYPKGNPASSGDGHVWAYDSASGGWLPKPLLNSSGRVDPARLGSGTANDTKLLYGDGAWRDAPASGGFSVIKMRIEKSDIQSVPVGGWNGVEWNSRRQDPQNWWRTADSGKYLYPDPGEYLIFALTIFGQNSSGFRASRVMKNGSDLVVASELMASGVDQFGRTTIAGSVTVALEDRLSMEVFHSSTIPLTFGINSPGRPYIELIRIK